MMYYNDGFFYHSLFGGFMSILFWVGIVLLVVWLVRSMHGGGTCCKHGQGHDNGDDSAMTILKERYARGEIGKEEFDAKKKDLVG